ncbi:MAG: hypothetical protein V9E98_13820 [Candidatus Nanopelagicales bacterium]
MADLYDFALPAAGGEKLSMWDLHGLVVLVVVLPPQARSTPQAEGVQKLYRTFSGQGLVVVGVPMSDRPGSGTDFGVTFPVMAPTPVDGPAPDPLFAWLHSELPGPYGTTDVSGYTKFLVARDGSALARFEPTADARGLIDAVQHALAAPVPAPPPRPIPVVTPEARTAPDDTPERPVSSATHDASGRLPVLPDPTPRGADGGEIVDAEIVSMSAAAEITAIEADLAQEPRSVSAELMDLAQELRVIEGESAVIDEQRNRPLP